LFADQTPLRDTEPISTLVKFAGDAKRKLWEAKWVTVSLPHGRQLVAPVNTHLTKTVLAWTTLHGIQGEVLLCDNSHKDDGEERPFPLKPDDDVSALFAGSLLQLTPGPNLVTVKHVGPTGAEVLSTYEIYPRETPTVGAWKNRTSGLTGVLFVEGGTPLRHYDDINKLVHAQDVRVASWVTVRFAAGHTAVLPVNTYLHTSVSSWQRFHAIKGVLVLEELGASGALRALAPHDNVAVLFAQHATVRELPFFQPLAHDDDDDAAAYSVDDDDDDDDGEEAQRLTKKTRN
jgi:hypothetical protein